jgi:large-conductance mechanosensitive channel
MLKELTQLARKGHVIELALAIVLAQTAIGTITSFMDNCVLPLIGLAFGGRSFPSLFINLTPGKVTTQGGPLDSIEKAHYAGASIIAHGAFFMALIQLVVVVLVVRGVLGWLGKLQSAAVVTEEGIWPPAPRKPHVTGNEPPLA